MKAGHTFVTTGPIVLLRVNGRLPGDAIDITPGTKVQVTAEAFGRELRSLEIVGHGKILAHAGGGGGERLAAEAEITPLHGLWIAAKSEGRSGQFAHTTSVYVTVNGDGFQNPETARAENVALSGSVAPGTRTGTGPAFRSSRRAGVPASGRDRTANRGGSADG